MEVPGDTSPKIIRDIRGPDTIKGSETSQKSVEVIQTNDNNTLPRVDTNNGTASQKTEPPGVSSTEKDGEDYFSRPATAFRDREAMSESSHSTEPLDFRLWKKIMASTSLCLIALVVGLESSVGSALIEPGIINSFDVPLPLGLVNVAIYLTGWPFGTAIFGPLSQVYGRRWPIGIGVFLFVIFQVPTGEAENLETILICRFLSGLFGSAPLVMVHSIFSDIWHPKSRDVALNCFTTSLLTGACLGPIIGSYLVANNTRGWRWVEYTTVIISAIIWLTIFFIPESSSTLLLEQRHIRKKKKRQSTSSQHDLERARVVDRNRMSTKRLINIWIIRPFVMLFTEPILLLCALHSALVLGVLYVTFETFMLPFVQMREWGPDTGTLAPFITMVLGILIASSISTYITIQKRIRHQESPPPQAEDHLFPAIIGAVLLSSGFFWFAWTSEKDVHWLAQAASCLFIGAGVLLTCAQSEAYCMTVYDEFPTRADSALAATIFLRSLFAAGFTMASRPLYDSMVEEAWATSIWGFISMAAIPIPLVLYIYGEKMRTKSRSARESSLVDDSIDALSRRTSGAPTMTTV